MTCPRCRIAMKETRGVHHRQRKFRCPRCGRVAMQRTNARQKSGRREES